MARRTLSCSDPRSRTAALRLRCSLGGALASHGYREFRLRFSSRAQLRVTHQRRGSLVKFVTTQIGMCAGGKRSAISVKISGPGKPVIVGVDTGRGRLKVEVALGKE